MESSASKVSNSNIIYICDISYTIRQQLCHYLDELNVWEKLARCMGFTNDQIQEITRRQKGYGLSPSVEILKIWGDQYHHTATELFVLLHGLNLYDGMRIIKNYVNRQQRLRLPQEMPASTSNNINSNNNEDAKLYKYHNGSVVHSKQPQSQQASDLINSAAMKEYASRILEINYEELTAATQNWHKNFILGKGGFGTVYQGYWKHTEVAIKRIQYCDGEKRENLKIQIRQSLNELKYLNSCRHDNILPLYGYSIRGERPCLIYQLMKGGSLEQRLNSQKLCPLTWQQRINICLGTARGINYLHTFRDKPLIHGDIKPANILLDQCLQPKIGDFGLAREGPHSINTEIDVKRIFGTRPYLPPEFLNSKKLSTKIDIYSFGVVLLETFTGLRVYDNKREQSFLAKHVPHLIFNGNCNFHDLLDKRMAIVRPFEEEICKRSIQLSLLCVADNANQRPEMVQILETINNYYNCILLAP